MSEMEAFRAEYPEWDEMPDDIVEKTLAYAMFSLRMSIDDLKGVSMWWFKRRFKRQLLTLERKLTVARDQRIRDFLKL